MACAHTAKRRHLLRIRDSWAALVGLQCWSRMIAYGHDMKWIEQWRCLRFVRFCGAELGMCDRRSRACLCHLA